MNSTASPLGPIVDIRGDGTWPFMADTIIEKLVTPFVAVDWKRFDLGLENRDATNDDVVADIIAALKLHKTGVKGPTITPTAEQARERGLKRAYKSPNGLIRRGIDGVAIPREPIFIDGVTALPPGLAMLRMATGGIYEALDVTVPAAGEISVMFKNASGEATLLGNKKTPGAGALLLEAIDTASLERYARYCFAFTLRHDKKRLILGHKVTITPVYDGLLMGAFERVFQEKQPDGTSFRERFAEKGIEYYPLLIDAVAELQVSAKLKPDTVLAMKNYDGDVQSDTMGGMAKSLALVTSSLESADGILMADPPHGTAEIFNKDWFERGILMANPTAYIFAYAEAIAHRGRLDGNDRAVRFAAALKQATTATIQAGLEEGFVTADIKLLEKYKTNSWYDIINAQDFMDRIAARIPAEYRLAAAPAAASMALTPEGAR